MEGQKEVKNEGEVERESKGAGRVGRKEGMEKLEREGGREGGRRK